MKLQKTVVLKTSPVALQVGEKELYVLGSEGSFYRIDTTALKVVDGFRIKLGLNQTIASAAIAKNRLACLIAGTSSVIVWDIARKVPIGSFKSDEKTITQMAFANGGDYLIAGSGDGELLLWSLKYSARMAGMPKLEGAIRLLCVSTDGRQCMAASSEGEILILDLVTMKSKGPLRLFGRHITAAEFVGPGYLFLGTESGHLLMLEITHMRLSEEIGKVVGEVQSVTISYEDEEFYVGMTDGTIALGDLAQRSLVTPTYLKMEGSDLFKIVSLHAGQLIGISADGHLSIFTNAIDEAALEAYIREGAWADAYALIEADMQLAKSPHCATLEGIWKRELGRAKVLLEEGKIEEAKALLAPFSKVPSKKGLIASLIADFAEFDKFKNAYENKKLALFYQIANQFPSFKETSYYRKIEEIWEKSFARAREILYENQNINEAKLILAPFAGIPEKTAMIKELMENHEILLHFKNRLVAKDYKGAFELVEKKPLLKGLSEYKKLQRYGEMLAARSKEALISGDLATAIQGAKVLVRFPDFEWHARMILDRANVYANYFSALCSGNKHAASEMVAKYPYLKSAGGTIVVEGEWLERFRNAQMAAELGDVAAIKRELGAYFDVKEKGFAIRSVLMKAYKRQFEQAIQEKHISRPDFTQGVATYISIFGYDKNIRQILERAKEELGYDISVSQFWQGTPEFWNHKQLPNQIV
ncbi:MAG: WD40 repeat domain-containing protein [Campylobacterales bacterium]